MNGRQLWNLHQRHKFLRAEASRDILKIRVLEMTFPEVFKRYSFSEVFKLFLQNSRKTGNNAVKMSQAFQDIARFKYFTDLKLFKYVFSVIQNWETDALQC